MDQLTQAFLWLHHHLVIAMVIFLPLSLVATELVKKRPPVEDAALKARFPKLVALRELIRGLGWDGPKIRMALAVIFLGRAWDPLAVLDPAPPTPRARRSRTASSSTRSSSTSPPGSSSPCVEWPSTHP